ncbi:hypothetical protein PG984_010705 [Apiospora sp. TS-2023a]
MASQDGLIPLAPESAFPDWEDIIKVNMDEESPRRAAEGDDRFLYTTALVTCIGIAISGVYASASNEKRYDRFMIHTTELNADKNYAALKAEVEAAKAQGLQDLQVHVAAPDPASVLEHESRWYMVEVHEFQLSLMRQLRALVESDDVESDDQPRIHWYPYPSCRDHDNASMALFSDRSVIAQHETQKSFNDPITRWRLDEKPWVSTRPPSDTDSLGNSSSISSASDGVNSSAS